MSRIKFNKKRLFGSGVIGNILEWYEFSLYGYFAPIIAKQFFPSDNQFSSLLATFGVFAIGYLMRPIGAAVAGYFGDKYGRKIVLSYTVIIMAIITTVIGLLPTHQTIGVFASILLTICRLIQGIAVGGEYSGSVVYLIEHAQANRRGLLGSLALFSSYFGIMLGSAVGAIVGFIVSEATLETWGWRIPFLLGSLLGILGLYLRKHMPETIQFEYLQKENKVLQNPIFYSIKEKPWLILTAIGVTFMPAVASYLLFVYLPTYLTTYSKVTLDNALLLNTFSMIIMLITIPIVGSLSDRIGRKPFLIIGCMLFILFSYPLFFLLSSGNLWLIFIAQALFGIMVAIAEAIIPATLAELFPTNSRYTGIALSLNIANGIFGGLTPLFATLLIQLTQFQKAPSIYLSLCAIISLIVILRIKETYKIKLN